MTHMPDVTSRSLAGSTACPQLLAPWSPPLSLLNRQRAAGVTRALALALSVAGASTSALAVTSGSVAVTGAVASPKTETLSSLQGLAQVTQTDSFFSGNPASLQTHTYTGPLLWNVIQDAGGIVTHPGIKNDTLNQIVLVTATDGYKVVYSSGELNPNFGAESALLAWGETTAGTLAPLGSDSLARSTAPLDSKGGRYVSNVSGVQVLSTASTLPYTSVGSTSTSFSVSGDVKIPGTTWNLNDLKSLTLPTITETIAGHTYTGVSLWSFLNAAAIGLGTNSSIKNDLLDMYLVAVGSDGYKAAFSMGELSPDFGNSLTPDDGNPLLDILAYQVDGQDLGSSGFARIVAPNDGKQGRWVSNLVSLEVYHAAAVPEPETCALMLAGLCLLSWQRKARSSGHH